MGTRKAERFFKERGRTFQLIDLSDKGISPGELRAVAAAVGLDALPDRSGKLWKEGGLEHMDFDLTEALLENPLLLRTPIVRDGVRAVVGADATAWKGFL